MIWIITGVVTPSVSNFVGMDWQRVYITDENSKTVNLLIQKWTNINSVRPTLTLHLPGHVWYVECMFTFPTTVDPVNDIFCTKGLEHRLSPTTPALSRDDVTKLNTPGGTPAWSAS